MYDLKFNNFDILNNYEYPYKIEENPYPNVTSDTINRIISDYTKMFILTRNKKYLNIAHSLIYDCNLKKQYKQKQKSIMKKQYEQKSIIKNQSTHNSKQETNVTIEDIEEEFVIVKNEDAVELQL